MQDFATSYTCCVLFFVLDKNLRKKPLDKVPKPEHQVTEAHFSVDDMDLNSALLPRPSLLEIRH